MPDPSFADAVAHALAAVSSEIKREVGALVSPAADTFKAKLQARYPMSAARHPGRPHMRDDVRIRTIQGHDPDLPARLVVGPRLGIIWQDGTAVRHDSTRRNANRGRMPAADPDFFERTAAQTRDQMLQRAQGVLDKTRDI